MSDEVERLRRMFEELEEQNKGVLGWACMALGIDHERTSAEWDDHVPMGKLYKPYTIDQLCERVEYLIENEGILSGVVIGGLLTRLVDMFDYMGDPNKVPDSIDTNMDMLDGLKRMRGMPFEERPAPLPDASLDRMIGQIEESFGRMRPHQAKVAEASTWWTDLTERGGEGMVVKPLDFIAKGKKGLIQPAVKCRGREYLRIIYGPDYTSESNLVRLRKRGLGGKRSLALREFALGIEALERFIRREPLRRVHECVFGVLALESEPVDPRL